MSQTISKGRMFRLTVTVDDARLKAMRKAPEIATAALQAGADYWHSKILPAHFDQGNAAKYGYAPRAIKYLNNRGKKGKPPLVFSGSLRRDLKTKAAFKLGAGTVDLTMSARVLNFAPSMPQNSAEPYVKHKNGRGYPNLKREIKVVTEEERAAVAAVVAATLEKLLNPSDT